MQVQVIQAMPILAPNVGGHEKPTPFFKVT